MGGTGAVDKMSIVKHQWWRRADYNYKRTICGVDYPHLILLYLFMKELILSPQLNSLVEQSSPA